ncbi:MAG: Na+/H+ antiporter subunit G [Candidatus Binatia bacterium]|nr:MAG: Na+/H+ antiporter subunit G [Candidatus Binatia bacterium]
MNVLGSVLLAVGGFFLFAGTVGLLRLPDFYTRLHATGKTDTLGASLSLLGLACFAGWSLVALKLVAVAVFLLVANPTATHALARAAYLRGIVPWGTRP